MNWHVGQDIVAVADHSLGDFKKGDVFVIKAIHASFCNCPRLLFDIGIKAQSIFSKCAKCNVLTRSTGMALYSDKCFAPLDQLSDISELLAVLDQPAFTISKP